MKRATSSFALPHSFLKVTKIAQFFLGTSKEEQAREKKETVDLAFTL